MSLLHSAGLDYFFKFFIEPLSLHSLRCFDCREIKAKRRRDWKWTGQWSISQRHVPRGTCRIRGWDTEVGQSNRLSWNMDNRLELWHSWIAQYISSPCHYAVILVQPLSRLDLCQTGIITSQGHLWILLFSTWHTRLWCQTCPIFLFFFYQRL